MTRAETACSLANLRSCSNTALAKDHALLAARATSPHWRVPRRYARSNACVDVGAPLVPYQGQAHSEKSCDHWRPAAALAGAGTEYSWIQQIGKYPVAPARTIAPSVRPNRARRRPQPAHIQVHAPSQRRRSHDAARNKAEDHHRTRRVVRRFAHSPASRAPRRESQPAPERATDSSMRTPTRGSREGAQRMA